MRRIPYKDSLASFHFGNDEKCWECRRECWRDDRKRERDEV